jgi:glycosyltransferase involved in cell wall biosynthesis
MFDRVLGRSVFGEFDVWFVLSASERDDVIRLFGVSPERVVVSPPFLSSEFAELAEGTPVRPLDEGPFVLSVGRIEARKNLPRMLAALDGLPYQFVVAGQDRGGLAALREEAARRPSVRLRYLGSVPEAEKIGWIKGAAAVLVPSLAEGVPAAALEALALGRPVVLAGVAYGPDGPGVVRCDPTIEGLHAAVVQATRLREAPARAVPTARDAARGILATLSAREASFPANSKHRTPTR